MKKCGIRKRFEHIYILEFYAENKKWEDFLKYV